MQLLRWVWTDHDMFHKKSKLIRVPDLRFQSLSTCKQTDRNKKISVHLIVFVIYILWPLLISSRIKMGVSFSWHSTVDTVD
jgi:hypothetical protein